MDGSSVVAGRSILHTQLPLRQISRLLVLHGVYFIPALRNSIMSLGQLDEGRSKVEIDKASYASGIAAGASSSW